MTKKKKIAVIDHDRVQHELIHCFCKYQGDYEIAHATSLDECLERIDIEEHDLILLENRLAPYRDYRETVPAIRKAGFGGRIVVMSVDIRDKEFAEHKAYDVDDCVDKFDFKLDTFSQMVEAFITQPALTAAE